MYSLDFTFKKYTLNSSGTCNAMVNQIPFQAAKGYSDTPQMSSSMSVCQLLDKICTRQVHSEEELVNFL